MVVEMRIYNIVETFLRIFDETLLRGIFVQQEREFHF